MPERFTETLRAASAAGWAHAVQHRFVDELFAGAVPDAVMARYLIQDHRFLDSFLVLLGAALAGADTFAPLRHARDLMFPPATYGPEKSPRGRSGSVISR
jgi:thiaminase (transcriptional activator TenA)